MYRVSAPWTHSVPQRSNPHEFVTCHLRTIHSIYLYLQQIANQCNSVLPPCAPRTEPLPADRLPVVGVSLLCAASNTLTLSAC